MTSLGLQREQLSCAFFFLLSLMCRDTWSRESPSEHQKPSLGWRTRGLRGRGHRHRGIPRAETSWRQGWCAYGESFSYLAQIPALVSSYRVQSLCRTSHAVCLWNILFKATCLGCIGLLLGLQDTSNIKEHMSIILAFPAPTCLCCLFLKVFLQVRGMETFPHQTP